MQTLILHNSNNNIFNKSNIFSFGASLHYNCLVTDALENLSLKKNKLFSKGKFNFLELDQQIELFPSIIAIAENQKEIILSENFKQFEQVLKLGHPYCQHIFYSNNAIESFFNDYLSFNKDASVQSNCEAFVHIGSLRERIINVHKVIPFDDNLNNLNNDIATQIEYQIANLYPSLVTNSNFTDSDIDKSIYLKVIFNVNTNIDIDITIKDITVITFENYHHHQQFNTLLEQIYNDLLTIKQDRHAALSLNSRNYIRVCRELDVLCEPIGRNWYFLKKGSKKAVYIPYHRTVQSKTAIDNAESKVITNQLLEKNGFNINKYVTTSLNKLTDSIIDHIFKQLRSPFVIKPTDQYAGYGVCLNITNKIIFKNAIEELKKLKNINNLIIEEQFVGALYRFVVLGDKVSAVTKSSYPLICGNGKDTLEQLINKYNKFNIRKIRIDDNMKLFLESINITLKTVIENGKTITVSYKKNGDAIHNVTNLVSEKYKQIAIEANKAIKLKINGVDMMIADNGEYRIIEMNPVPGPNQHFAPNYGESIDVFKKVIECVLDNASNEYYNCEEIYKYHN